MISQIAFEKRRAAESRFKPRPAGVEDTRTVYLDSCKAVAEDFLADGYRFAKSGPHLTKKSGPWKYEICFQSSHNNVAGVHVALWCFAVVWNSELKRWRVENNSPFSSDDRFAGGQIGNLIYPTAWFDWELASRADRNNVIKGIIETIRAIALPFFALLSDVEAVKHKLMQREIPGLDIDAGIELLLWQGNKEAAGDYIDRFLMRRPDLESATRRDIARALSGELRSFNGYTATIARAVAHYGLRPKITLESAE